MDQHANAHGGVIRYSRAPAAGVATGSEFCDKLFTGRHPPLRSGTPDAHFRSSWAMERIYLDHAATTPLDERVLSAMLPYLQQHYGNASSAHSLGRLARNAVEECRERVAVHLRAHPSEIIFTSGGTEADNAAIRGMLAHTGRGLVTSAVEHAAVLETAAALQAAGTHVTILEPDSNGSITAGQVARAITPQTGLVSVALVNNELGTIAPLRAIGDVCRDSGVPLHTDAVQAATVMSLDVRSLNVDLMTLSGHKIYGPKGVGVLYARAGLDFGPFIVGGSQERKRRGGTENVAAIVGFAEALDLAAARRDAESARLATLRQRLEQRLAAEMGDTFVVNTPIGGNAAPHILNIALKPSDGRQIDGEMLLLNLDMDGVMVSAGSACASGTVQVSHVLTAIGLDEATASAAVRFSLGRSTTGEAVAEAARRLGRITRRMRGRRSA